MENINNLSIGWVAQAEVVNYNLTPGFKPIRKIVYSFDGTNGKDLINTFDNKEIKYPVFNPNFNNNTVQLENGQLFIYSYANITDYLGCFGFKSNMKLNRMTAFKLSNFIFKSSSVLEPNILKKKLLGEKVLESQKQKLADFKIISGSSELSDTEIKYLIKRK